MTAAALTAPVNELPKDMLIEAMTGDAAELPGDHQRPGRPAARQADARPSRLSAATMPTSGLPWGAAEWFARCASSGRQVSRGGSGRTDPPLPGQLLSKGPVWRSATCALHWLMGSRAQDRHHEGLVLSQSVADNVTMAIGDRLGARRPAIAGASQETPSNSLSIVASGAGQPVSLFGGNQQKVVVGRALASDPRILVLIDPTAGVDVKSKPGWCMVAGKAILLASGELEDLRIWTGSSSCFAASS